MHTLGTSPILAQPPLQLSWSGVAAPAGTPTAAIQKMQAELTRPCARQDRPQASSDSLAYATR